MDFVHIIAAAAAILLLAGFLFRDLIWLRILAIASSLLFILYFALAFTPPNWPGLLAGIAIATANLVMLYLGSNEKRMFRLSAEEMMLYARLPGLTPGQFKQLLMGVTWSETRSREMLTQEGTMPTDLHYVLEGKVEVNRTGTIFSLGPHAFVGELAFLRQKPATATVHAEPGALIVSWPVETLRTLFERNAGIKQVMTGLLSAVLAEKIARIDRPILVDQSKGK